MARPDRLERLTDLVLVLLGANRPLTLDAIADEVPGYPDEHDARRQAFERDKRLLRDEGIPVATEPVEGQEQFGYRIPPEQFYLPDLHLEPDEQAALNLAVAGVRLGDPSGRHALLKLGATGLAESRPVASLVPPGALVPLFDAVRSRAEVRFLYRGQSRRIAPGGVWFRSGRWYVVGWDLERSAARTFRVDRISDRPLPGDPGSGLLPEGFDPAASVPDEVLRSGEDDEDPALVWVDRLEAPRLVEEVGQGSVVERRDDGSVVLSLGVTSADGFQTWVLGLLGHAVVLGPRPLRDAIVHWLDALASPTIDDGNETAAHTGALEQHRPDREVGGSALDHSSFDLSQMARLPAGERSSDAPSRRDPSQRLRVLLAVVGWLARVGEAPLADVACRFGLSEKELVHDLELAACCGVPPYTPDALMEIIVTEHTVSARLPDEMARPRRLTAAEGFALVASGRTILAVPGADEGGSLARALDKLESTLGDHVQVVVDLDTPALLAEARAAAYGDRQLVIDYHSASMDEETRRVVDPWRVIALDGHWYLDAFCHMAGGQRRFRVDRIRSMAPTGSSSAVARTVDEGESSVDAFVPGVGARIVRLLLDREADWVLDSVPILNARSEGERTEVTLAIGGTAWLARLLVQLGPHALVVEPHDLARLGQTTAAAILAGYRALDAETT